jgi:hypothetical protein
MSKINDLTIQIRRECGIWATYKVDYIMHKVSLGICTPGMPVDADVSKDRIIEYSFDSETKAYWYLKRFLDGHKAHD